MSNAVPEQAVEAARTEYCRVIAKAVDDRKVVTSKDGMEAMRAALEVAAPLMGVQREDALRKALKRCIEVFEQLAAAGNYPAPLYQNGGWKFAVDALATAQFKPCPGCDGHECDWTKGVCAYPRAQGEVCVILENHGQQSHYYGRLVSIEPYVADQSGAK